ncbi:MAG TPA: pyruvate kinase [Chthoniobacterales bacterium]|jgi:pyruvate kinase
MNPSRPQKRTKIVATLGPASSDEATLREMMLAGMDVVRINFSHAVHDQLMPVLERVRRLANELKIQVAVLGDLRGPRIRVGRFPGGAITLDEGSTVKLAPGATLYVPGVVPVSHSGMGGDVKEKDLVLLDDGNLELCVRSITPEGHIDCRVIRGGVLKDNKGINLPGVRVSLPALTPKDLIDVDFAIANHFDFLAMSFVQTSADVLELRRHLTAAGSKIGIVSKIENKSSLDDIEAIARDSDAVMVARGDLALEVSFSDVPLAQKTIIDVCRQQSTPVITATQMLESMIGAHKPTRAEAADVANAILDGTDALMLSAESAAGKYPALSIATMSEIAVRVESALTRKEVAPLPALNLVPDLEACVGHAAQMISKTLSAKVIVTATFSGLTANRVACHRPNIPIMAIVSDPVIARRLSLCWGIESVLTDPIQSTSQLVRVALSKSVELYGAKPGDIITITAGTPYNQKGTTNLIKVERVPASFAEES